MLVPPFTFSLQNEKLQQLACIETSVKNLSQVQLWFARISSLSVEAVYPTVQKILKTGWYGCKKLHVPLLVVFVFVVAVVVATSEASVRFQSRLRRAAQGELFTAHYLLEDQKQPVCLLSDEMNDLLRGAIFCSTDAIDEAKKQEITVSVAQKRSGCCS